MTFERAMEILNPEHREHYDSFETVNKTYRIGMQAIEKQIPKKPLPEDKLYGNGKCPRCNAVLLDKSTKYCGNCGQKLLWSEVIDND